MTRRSWASGTAVNWSSTMRAAGAAIIGGVLFAVSSCAEVRQASPRAERVVKPAPIPVVKPLAPPSPVAAVIDPPRLVKREQAGIVFEGVAFDSRSHRLRVIDQAGGPGSAYADAAAAGQAHRGIAAVNGGFFTPEGQPLGLVIADGQRRGTWNASTSLGSGLWHEDTSGRAAISRRGNAQRAAGETRELLQAGPLLIENGRAVGGLETQKASARTMILWDGGHRWWIGRCSPSPLAAVAAALADSEIPGWRVRHALNLDGGRSAELWVSTDVTGGPRSIRPAWNRPVRNFLVLVHAP